MTSWRHAAGRSLPSTSPPSPGGGSWTALKVPSSPGVHQFLEMSGCQGQMLLSALALSLLAGCVSGAPQRNPPSQTKHLQLLKNEDPACSLLVKLVLELVALRGEEMPQEMEEEELGGRERLIKRRLVRFTHRERKAGCRNFFWKSFTSC